MTTSPSQLLYKTPPNVSQSIKVLPAPYNQSTCTYSNYPNQSQNPTNTTTMSSDYPETPITRHTLSSNAAYAKDSHPSDMAQTGPAPTQHYAVITCMDARLLPSVPSALGIAPGAAHIIRNGGGSAHDALRSLLASQHMLMTEEVLVIKHTDCGFSHFAKNEVVREKVAGMGEGAKRTAEAIDFGPIGEDLEGAVRRDVEYLRGEEALKHRGKISGWVWETDSGRLRRVC